MNAYLLYKSENKGLVVLIMFKLLGKYISVLILAVVPIFSVAATFHSTSEPHYNFRSTSSMRHSSSYIPSCAVSRAPSPMNYSAPVSAFGSSSASSELYSSSSCQTKSVGRAKDWYGLNNGTIVPLYRFSRRSDMTTISSAVAMPSLPAPRTRAHFTSISSYGSNGTTSSYHAKSRRRLGPPSGDDYWIGWLDDLDGDYYDEVDGIKYIDRDALYDFWLNNHGGGGMPDSWEEFMNWWNQYHDEEVNPQYEWLVPVGNILPLLLFALLFAAYKLILTHRKPSAQSQSSAN